jgi:hypothetical protein
MAVVMENNEALLRQQGQREADADSGRNNQIESAAVAAAAVGDGEHTRAMAA